MEIVCIFDGTLYSIHYGTEEANEFERLFDIWQDVEWLENFFEQHKEDLLSGFYGDLSVEEAILATLNEARDLEKTLFRLANSNIKDQHAGLDQLFKPLNNSQYRVVELAKSKAYGNHNKSWLRIYALKISDDVYIITGGAIKLTATMQEREHTIIELAKMNRCRDFLKENGFTDDSSFKEFEI